MAILTLSFREEQPPPRMIIQAAIGGGLIGAGSLALGIFGITLFSHLVLASPSGGAQSLLKLLAHFFHFAPFMVGVWETIFGFGSVGSLIVAALAITCVARRRWWALTLAILCLAPPFVYALGNLQPARRWIPVIYAMALAAGFLGQAGLRGRPPGFVYAIPHVAFLLNLIVLPFAGNALAKAGVNVNRHTLLYRATANVLLHHRINQAYLYRSYIEMAHLRKTAPDESLIVGAFADAYLLMTSYCRDNLPARAQVIGEAPGYFLTRVTGPRKTLLVAEVQPLAQLGPLTAAPPALYTMNGSVPPPWRGLTNNVTDLTPQRKDRFAMWLRRP